MGKGRKVKCMKCGDIIQSMHRHDMQFCKCKAVAIDGGSDYCKLSGEPSNVFFVDTGKTLSDGMKEYREKEIKTKEYVDSCLNSFKNSNIKIEGKVIYVSLNYSFSTEERNMIDNLIEYHNYGLQENLPLEFDETGGTNG